MSLIIFVSIIIVKKLLLADYRSFWLKLGDATWVIYYCHHITEIIYFLYLLAKSGEFLSGLISALGPSGSFRSFLMFFSVLH